MAGGNFGGPFTGLYQGATGANDAANALKPLLPNVSVYQQGSSTAPQLQAQVTTPTQSASTGSAFSKFGHFLGGLGNEIGHMATGAATWLGHTTLNAVHDTFAFGTNLGHNLVDQYSLHSINSQQQQYNNQLNTLHAMWRSGKIDTPQYSAELKVLSGAYSDLGKQAGALSQKSAQDIHKSVDTGITAASTIITILTAGVGAAGDAAITADGLVPTAGQARLAGDWLTSKMMQPVLQPVVDTINRVASQPEVFKALEPGVQQALQKATAEVVSTTTPMTAGQLARATATNVALKYPLYFNYLSTTGKQVYQQLDQAKYGDAIRTIGFNALLTLSGGPIGHALQYGGDALKGLSNRTFGQTAFWDELSKYYGQGNADGFAKAVMDHANSITNLSERGQFIKNINAVEATNVKAMGGNAAAAALRLANGMKNNYGFDLSTVDHASAINDMVNFAKNQRIADETAQKYGLTGVTAGRFDARDKAVISAALTGNETGSALLNRVQGDTSTVAGRLQLWEDLKSANPNQSWANNASLDRQVKTLISQHEDPAALDGAIRDIKTGFSPKGFPASVAKSMAKDGYIPIRPSSLEAPFQEGSGKIVSKFGSGDFFTKAVQPLPILGHIGDMLTKAGLSPNAANQTVYESFTHNLAANLTKSGINGIGEIAGETAQQGADTLIKQLSDYAHGLKVPMTDLRMMSTKDIMKATGVSQSEAVKISRAIDRSHLQVSMAIKGLGDQAVDLAHAASPLFGKYMRLMGNLRFSFNPFFQYLRVIPKTEILTESAGGGYLRSIFQGRAGAINDVREGLRSGGYLDEAGHIGNVTSGEAADLGGVDQAMSTTRNLGKRLLPMQERSIAGLIDSQAQRMGMTWQDYIHAYPQNVRDTIQSIAEYDRKSNFLNSPLARTLNVAIFPFRFDAKVAGYMAKGLANTSMMTQVSVINGLMKAHDWLNTPEGQAWYSHNAEVIGIFKYITPLATLSEAFQSLLPGHDHSLGNFGELGGLPFGWIPQLLDAEGLTHFNQPGVDAKTGQMIPQYVPASDRGQAAIAVQDFLASLFSYPGATAGLESKAAITRYAGLALTGSTKSKDLKLVPPDMNPQQQKQQQQVQAATGTTPHQATPQSYMSHPSDIFGVQPTSTAPDLAAEYAAKVRAKAAAKAAKPKAPKKADFKPVPAPGQSALGVL